MCLLIFLCLGVFVSFISLFAMNGNENNSTSKKNNIAVYKVENFVPYIDYTDKENYADGKAPTSYKWKQGSIFFHYYPHNENFEIYYRTQNITCYPDGQYPDILRFLNENTGAISFGIPKDFAFFEILKSYNLHCAGLIHQHCSHVIATHKKKK